MANSLKEVDDELVADVLKELANVVLGSFITVL